MNDAFLSGLFFGILGLSIRWALVIAFLGLALALFKPRQAVPACGSVRLSCFGGCLFLVLPVFWGPVLAGTPSATPTRLLSEGDPEPISGPRASQQGNFDRKVPKTETSARSPTTNDEPELASSRTAREVQDLASSKAHASLPSDIASESAAQSLPGRNLPVELATWSIRVVMAAWLVGILFSLLRLVSGWLWLRRMYRSAIAPSPGSLGMLKQCQVELQMERAPGLLFHRRLRADPDGACARQSSFPPTGTTSPEVGRRSACCTS